MRIAYFLKDMGGCSYYRAILPLDTLHEQKLADVMRVESGADTERTATALAEADVVVFPRISANDKMLRIFDQLQEDGKLIVADYDDNIWKVTPLSPHYKDYGMVEYQHVLPDKQRINVWKDGVGGFSLRTNRERLRSVDEALKRSGLVTTTTPILAEVLRKKNPNVVALPNCVNLARWKPIPLIPHDEVRLFWAGGASHFEDLQILVPVLQAVMQRFTYTKLVIMGQRFEGILKDLPQDRVEFHPWEDNLSYPLRCSIIGADISLIPLLDNPFNRCKSPIKWVEQAALGVPAVVSFVSPYAEIYNGDNAVMVEGNNTEAWVEAVSTLVRDPVLRARIGGKARRYVEANFDITRRAVEWLRAFEQYRPAPAAKMEAAACQ